MQQQQPATDAELVDALSRTLRGLPPPPPSQPFFTVHDVSIFHPELQHPSSLYDRYGGGGAACVYFFSSMFTYQDGWKVAAGTQAVLDAAGGEVGVKDTLVFHEGRWLPKTCWAMDEFRTNGIEYYLDSSLRLYRLRRLDDDHP